MILIESHWKKLTEALPSNDSTYDERKNNEMVHRNENKRNRPFIRPNIKRLVMISIHLLLLLLQLLSTVRQLKNSSWLTQSVQEQWVYWNLHVFVPCLLSCCNEMFWLLISIIKLCKELRFLSSVRDSFVVLTGTRANTFEWSQMNNGPVKNR